MEKTAIIAALVALVIGGGVGYALGAQKGDVATTDVNSIGHVMPDGSNMETDMSMEEMMSSMNAELAGKTGDEFDRAFMAEMIVHHEGAVGMAEAALTNAKHQEIKDMANAIITAQNAEIKQMQDWQKSWYEN